MLIRENGVFVLKNVLTSEGSGAQHTPILEHWNLVRNHLLMVHSFCYELHRRQVQWGIIVHDNNVVRHDPSHRTQY